MTDFPNIAHMLSSAFSAATGLSAEAGIRVYLSAVESSGKADVLRQELAAAFESAEVSWMQRPYNDEYEVFEAASEEEAQAFARRVLWDPLVAKHA